MKKLLLLMVFTLINPSPVIAAESCVFPRRKLQSHIWEVSPRTRKPPIFNGFDHSFGRIFSTI
jgi:hypothetical protein